MFSFCGCTMFLRFRPKVSTGTRCVRNIFYSQPQNKGSQGLFSKRATLTGKGRVQRSSWCVVACKHKRGSGRNLNFQTNSKFRLKFLEKRSHVAKHDTHNPFGFSLFLRRMGFLFWTTTPEATTTQFNQRNFSHKM